MSRMNVRPKHGGGPAYSPQRDLAYIYAPAMKEALRALDAAAWSDCTKALVETLEITEDDISIAVVAILEAHKLFVNEPDIDSAEAALQRAGWYEAEAGARYLIYGRLGEVMLGGFFLALRDTSEIADESSQQREIADFIAEGRKLLGLEDLAEGSIDWRDEATMLREELTLQRRALGARKQQYAGLRAHLDIVDRNYTAVLKYYKNEGFWSGLWRLIRTRLPGRSKTPESDKHEKPS